MTGRRGKNRKSAFIGSYLEPSAAPIDLPFTVANFGALLSEGAQPESHFSHQQIKDWAARFWWQWFEQPPVAIADRSPSLREIANLAQEVEMRWDMYLGNQYALDVLQSLDFSQVRLPYPWFDEWHERLRTLVGPSDAQ